MRRGRTVGCCCAPGTPSAPAALARLKKLLCDDDLTDEIGAAWAIKELLRQATSSAVA